jgi:DNA (cytosine-5)-methyltransferase 1
MRVLSLFSGMGGMDIGFSEDVIVHRDSVPHEWVHEEHGPPGFVRLKRLPFEIVFQNDILPEAKEFADLNGWAHNYHLKDIWTLLAEDFPFPAADVVTGGFPCQDFSHAGKRKGFDSARGTLYQAFVEVVRRVQPKVFVAENVNGLLTMPGEPIRQIVADFASVGYDVTYQRIKCEEIGIPQTRWRVLIFGARSDLHLPEGWATLQASPRTCPVGPYFRHLAEPDTSKDPAQQIYSKAARLDKGQGQSEVRLVAPGPTMRAEHHGNIEFRRIKGGCNEPDLPERRLTVREAALIQTFPPGCLLVNPKTPSSKAYRPIGNAVPPLLGYVVARTVYSGLNPIDVRRFFRLSTGSSPPSTSASGMPTEK